MTKKLSWIIAIMAIVAPTLHLLSDLLEVTSSGFSSIQLLINYAGFLPMPFVMLGLYAYQHPKISWIGLIGTLLYGVAFIYFAHTTLVALEEAIPNYEILWRRLGVTYTFHGGLMVAGGLMLGIDAFRTSVLSRISVSLFIIGIILNLGMALLPLPEVLQIFGSSVRNLGLMAMGLSIISQLRRAKL
jgi:hypothetical protein